MDQQTIVGLVVTVIVAVLSFIVRYWKPDATQGVWLELVLSALGGAGAAFVLKMFTPFPGLTDPVATLEWIGVALSVIFALTKTIFALVQKAFPTTTSVRRAFKLASILIIPLIALSMFAPMVARADAPQPWQYAAVQCSGLGTVENVVYATQQFDTQYGFDHQLTTNGQWQTSYIARTNQFASSVGCPQVLWDDGTLSGSLTMFYRVYVPWYQKYSQSFAALKASQVK